MTRRISAALFILAAILSSAAIVSFIAMSLDNACWNRDDYEPEPAASAWMNILGVILFVVAASCSMGLRNESSRSTNRW